MCGPTVQNQGKVTIIRETKTKQCEQEDCCCEVETPVYLCDIASPVGPQSQQYVCEDCLDSLLIVGFDVIM